VRSLAVPAAEHGGALAQAQARFGAADDWLDLSTGLNPWPYPLPPIPPAIWQRLPDEDVLAAVKSAARRFYGAGPDAPIAAGPGSQALIQLLPRLLPPSEVAVLSPGYAEHQRSWRLAGHRVAETATLETATAPILVFGNPNNPDGRRFGLEDVSAALNRREPQGWVVIDEAFAEVAGPGVSMAAAAGRRNLVIFRSFGKFFGLGGLRLGFVLAPTELVERIDAALGPWAVSGPALAIAGAALADRRWAAATCARLQQQSAALDAVLLRHGLTILGGTDLFRLVETERAASLFDQLCRAHILSRAFSAWPNWLRFGLPPDAAALDRLDRALG
jgi:cobalamin biosynthesis protein CobC